MVKQLRSLIPRAKKPKHKQQKQYCNKFNTDLKMVHLEKKKVLKENKAERFEAVQRPHPQYSLCGQ